MKLRSLTSCRVDSETLQGIAGAFRWNPKMDESIFLLMHSGVQGRPFDDKSCKPLIARLLETNMRVWENEGARPPLELCEGARPPLTLDDDFFKESESVSMLCPINLCCIMKRCTSSRSQIDELDGMARHISPPPRRHSAQAYKARCSKRKSRSRPTSKLDLSTELWPPCWCSFREPYVEATVSGIQREEERSTDTKHPGFVLM